MRIINSKENKYFVARYTACLMSAGDYCYFQDDDWRNDWLRSMYSSFLRSPHLLHTITNEFVHYLTWAWSFFEPGTIRFCRSDPRSPPLTCFFVARLQP